MTHNLDSHLICPFCGVKLEYEKFLKSEMIVDATCGSKQHKYHFWYNTKASKLRRLCFSFDDMEVHAYPLADNDCKTCIFAFKNSGGLCFKLMDIDLNEKINYFSVKNYVERYLKIINFT